MNSFNFAHFKSSFGKQVRKKFDHLQFVRNSHGTLKMVLIIGMMNYFLGPESSRIKNCGLTELKGKCIEMVGNSNCASKTTSKSKKNHEIWSFIAFALCHNNFEVFWIRSTSCTLNPQLGSKFVRNLTMFNLYEIHMERSKWS